MLERKIVLGKIWKGNRMEAENIEGGGSKKKTEKE